METTFSIRVIAIAAGLAIVAAVPALTARPGGAASRAASGAAAGVGVSQQAVGTAAQAAAVRYWTPGRMTRDLVRQPPPVTPPAWLSGDTLGAGLRWTHGGTVAAAVGRVFFTLGGADYVCSGALVGGAHPGVVLTAAHCVTGGPGRGRATQWATNWVFVPGFADGRLPYGEYTAHSFLVPPEWAGPGGGESDDFAFVQVTAATPTAGPDAAEPPHSSPHGLPVEFASGRDAAGLTRSYVFGYPAEPPYAGLYPVFCAGQVTVWAGSVRMPCDMTAGDSGGPWLAWFRPRSGSGLIAAVTTYKMSGDLAVLYGTVLGPRARALYQRAVRPAR